MTKHSISDQDQIIQELRESNVALTAALKTVSLQSSQMFAERPTDRVLDHRRPEDMLSGKDKFKTIEEKWDSILKNGGLQLYKVSMKPWIHRAKSEHSLIVCGLTAAEILYYHHEYDDPEKIAKGITESIYEVIEVVGMVSAVNREGLYDAMRNTKERGQHIFDQKRVDRLYGSADKIPLDVASLEDIMPKPPGLKGIFGITVDSLAERTFVNKIVKLADGGNLDISYYEDDTTRTSSAGVLWRRTGTTGG